VRPATVAAMEINRDRVAAAYRKETSRRGGLVDIMTQP
jgi:hypothetical protein